MFILLMRTQLKGAACPTSDANYYAISLKLSIDYESTDPTKTRRPYSRFTKKGCSAEQEFFWFSDPGRQENH